MKQDLPKQILEEFEQSKMELITGVDQLNQLPRGEHIFAELRGGELEFWVWCYIDGMWRLANSTNSIRTHASMVSEYIAVRPVKIKSNIAATIYDYTEETN